MAEKRVATIVDWAVAPEWLTLEEACSLSGWDAEEMQHIIEEGGVELDESGLIWRESLYEFQEALALVANWED